MPAGNQSGNSAAVEQVLTNQPQTLTKQLPDLTVPLYCAKNYIDFIEHAGVYTQTCGNINAIELLTTQTPASIFQTYIQTFSTLTGTGNPEMIFSGTGPGGTINVTGSNQQINIALRGIPSLGQGPFSVLTERFDPTNYVISVVTLQGHPLAGWRYFRVYSIGTNDVVVETGAYDQPGPTLKNYAGYFWGGFVISRAWYYYLTSIQTALGAPQGSNLQGTIGGIQEPLYSTDPNSLLRGYWDLSGEYTNYILTNVCVTPPCN